MRLALHTLQKDLRRLWPVIAATWIMLAFLTRADRWRADTHASAMEGWMNPLLTMAWACLAALAVLEEPLVGHRSFWTTRPYRWFPLLLSKVLFVIVTIHLMSFAADVYVLAARGFSPLAYPAELLLKQVILFGGVIVPAIALASLVKNFTQFVIALFVIAACVAVLGGDTGNFPALRHRGEDVVRQEMVWVLLSVAGAAAILLQYARRRVFPARSLAIAAASIAATVYAAFPVSAAFRVLGRFEPTPQLTLLQASSSGKQPTLTLRVGVQGGATHDDALLPVVDARVYASNGAVIESGHFSPGSFQKLDLMISSMPRQTNEPTLSFYFSRPAWEKIRNSRVRIRGTAGVEFYRDGDGTVLPMQGSAMVPGVGQCGALIVGDQYSRQMLKVFCESPGKIPMASIVLRDPQSGREWQNALSTFAYAAGPRQTWLSPLERAQAFFQTSDSEYPGSTFIVPASLLPTLRVRIVRRLITGYALAPFEFPEVEVR